MRGNPLELPRSCAVSSLALSASALTSDVGSSSRRASCRSQPPALSVPAEYVPSLWKWAPEIHVLISLSVDSDVLSMWEPLPKGNMAGMKQSKNRSSNDLNKFILNYNVKCITFNTRINLFNLFFSMEQNKSILYLYYLIYLSVYINSFFAIMLKYKIKWPTRKYKVYSTDI